jgi:hypothetical protein
MLIEDDFNNNKVLYSNTIIIAYPKDSLDLELEGDYSNIDS